MTSRWGEAFDVDFRLVTVDRRTGGETGEVAGLRRAGRVSRNLDSQTKESGSVEVVGAPDFGAHLVRLYADFSWPDGETAAEALGTFVPSWSDRTADGEASRVTVTLSGRLSELAGDYFDHPVTFAAGTPTVSAAASIAAEAGFEVVAEPSSHVLASSRSYGAGDEDQSKLSVINDLLALAGFSSAETDPMGRVVLKRYTEPSRRPVALSFSEGPRSRMLREVVDSRDSSGVPNVVHAVYSTPESTVVGVAVDEDPASPFSLQSRGFRVVRRERYSDASTQAAADRKAAELLRSSQSLVRRVTFEHPYNPAARLGEVVAVDYPSADVSTSVAVRTQDVALGDGLMVRCEGREV